MQTIFKKSLLSGLVLLTLISSSAEARGGGGKVEGVRQDAVNEQESGAANAQEAVADQQAETVTQPTKAKKKPQTVTPQVIPPSGGFYFGAFGGYGAARNNWLKQSGTIFLPAGPINVVARGRAQDNNSSGGGWGGLHVGYEWPAIPACPCWLIPGAELEAFYIGLSEQGELDNAAPAVERSFIATYPMHTWVMMANTVWALKIPDSEVLPYLGIGFGAADVSISGANSYLVAPTQPAFNYYNSNTHASNWAFAMQAKAGLRFIINCHWRIFAEYRYIYISPTSYTFGSRQYAGAAPTSNWNVRIGSMNNNMGALGIEYTL